MSIKRIFIVISAIFAASAVFADNSSVTSKKYVDDLMSGYQGKLPGSGANKLMIYDDETGIGEKSIEATLGSGATGVPTVGAVKTGLDGVQDTITGTAGYVMTGTGTPGDVGERAIYGTAVYSNSLVTAETVNTGVTNAVNSSLIRVDTNGNPSDNGTLWEINTDLYAIGVLPPGYTQLEYIESRGTQYIDTGLKLNQNNIVEVDWMYYTESTITTSGRMFGARYTSGSRNSFSIGSNSGKASIETDTFAQFGDNSVRALNNIVIGQWNTYKVSADGFYVSGVKQGDFPVATFETPFTVKLFAFEQASSSGATPAVGGGCWKM